MPAPTLSPTQRTTFTQAAKDVADASLVVVWAGTGLGRTTILRALQRRFEGVTPPWMRGTPDVDGDEDVP
jgi:hypothetical protein